MRIRFSFFLSSLVCLAGLSILARGAFADKLGTITIQSGEVVRIDSPVSVEIADGDFLKKPIRLNEVKATNEKAATPFQLDPADTGNPRHLWLILTGTTEPNTTRTYEIEDGQPASGEPVGFTFDGRALEIGIGGQKVFRYNYAFIPPPEGVDYAFVRSGYIHPLFGPTTQDVLTEDHPKDHYHHKGIWMPWVNTEFEGHHVDFWNLGDKTGTVRFAGFESVASGPVFGGFRVRHEHVDLTQDKPKGGRIALNEVWDVRVWNVGGKEKGYWLFDLESRQIAPGSPLKMLEYRYGGLGFRGAKQWIGNTYKALTSEGKTQANGHLTRAKWCDNSGAIDGRWAGVTLMDHPSNFRFPNSMRMWPVNGCFFNFSPPELGDFTIEPNQPYVSRYRFFVHEGEINKEEDERRWNDYANPPKAEFKAE